MLKRTAALLLLGAVLLACSGDDNGGAVATTTTRKQTTATEQPADAVPAWLRGIIGDQPLGDLRPEVVDGQTIYVSDKDRMVYAENCDVAENDAGTGITQEGQKYGPTPRDADGSGGEAGYGSVCANG